MTPTLRDVYALRRRGLIPADRVAEAAAAVRDDPAWAGWAGWALLALGAGHLLSGIVCFFAFNWADMSAVAKFGVVEAGIVIAAVAAWIVGIFRPVGQALLIAASVLVGVLLAVIGQVYHTDADAYSLFAAWTLLILPWTLASRSAAHWFLWLVVLYLALLLWGEQALVPQGYLTSTLLQVALGAGAGLFLALRETAVRSGFGWLAASWTRLALLTAGLAILFWPSITYLIDLQGDAYAPIAMAIAFGIAAAAYRRLLPDFAAMAIVVGFAVLFAIAVGGRLLAEMLSFDVDDTVQILSGLGLLVLWSVACVAVGAKMLLALHRRREAPQA